MGWWSLFDWGALALVASCLGFVLVRRPPAALWPSLPIALTLYLTWMIGDLGTTRDLERPHLWLGLLHGSAALTTGAAWIVGLRFAEAYGRPFVWGRRRWVYAPVAVSCAIAAVAITNPWHGAYLEPVPGSRSQYGPLAFLAGLYLHGFSLAMVGLYASLRIRHRSWMVRRKATLMMFAYAAGPVFNALYVLPSSPPPFDVTVLSILTATSLVMLGVYRTGLFNPLPVALPEVISNDPNPIVLLDPHGYPFFANDAARELLPGDAWTPDAPLHTHLARALRRPNSRAPVDPAELEQQLGSKENAPFGHLYRLEAEPPRWVRVQRSPIRTAQGLEIGSCIRFQDVSALLDAEARVQEGEARFRALADHAHDLVVEIDAEGRYLYVNARHLEVFGHDESLLHQGGDVLLLAAERGRAQEHFSKLVETGQAIEQTYRAVDRTGQMRWIEVTGSAFATPTGETRAVMIGRDVTERQRAQEVRRLESLGTLAGGIARDLNDLLVPILGNVSFLLEEISQHEDTEETLTEIEQAATRAADLVARLMAYVGETPMERQRLDLRNLISGMRPAIEADPGRKGTLRFDVPPDLPAVSADPERLRPVLLALVRNAWEALPDAGSLVTVAASLEDVGPEDLAGDSLEGALSSPGRYVRLRVEDTGRGIDPELRARIFDPFFSTKGPTRGLGLAIALGVVRAHGGALRMHSQPGKGSVFEVLLPCAD